MEMITANLQSKFKTARIRSHLSDYEAIRRLQKRTRAICQRTLTRLPHLIGSFRVEIIKTRVRSSTIQVLPSRHSRIWKWMKRMWIRYVHMPIHLPCVSRNLSTAPSFLSNLPRQRMEEKNESKWTMLPSRVVAVQDHKVVSTSMKIWSRAALRDSRLERGHRKTMRI